MQTEKRAAVRTKEIESRTNVVASVEFVVRAILNDTVEDDFVQSIAGRIIAQAESPGEEDAVQISASLVQFGEALDHGISAERLGDGLSGDISEYWEHLFDAETGYPKGEIQNEFEVVDLDLLPYYGLRRTPPRGQLSTSSGMSTARVCSIFAIPATLSLARLNR